MTRVTFQSVRTGDTIPGFIEIADDGTVTHDQFGGELLNSGSLWKLPLEEAARTIATSGWSNAYVRAVSSDTEVPVAHAGESR